VWPYVTSRTYEHKLSALQTPRMGANGQCSAHINPGMAVQYLLRPIQQLSQQKLLFVPFSLDAHSFISPCRCPIFLQLSNISQSAYCLFRSPISLQAHARARTSWLSKCPISVQMPHISQDLHLSLSAPWRRKCLISQEMPHILYPKSPKSRKSPQLPHTSRSAPCHSLPKPTSTSSPLSAPWPASPLHSWLTIFVWELSPFLYYISSQRTANSSGHFQVATHLGVKVHYFGQVRRWIEPWQL
jgi:hypothetical protein